MSRLCRCVLVVGFAFASGRTAIAEELFDGGVFDWSLDTSSATASSGGGSSSASASGGGSYALSSNNLFGDKEYGWPGFLTGMRSSSNLRERFAEPVGNSLYFESPFIDSNLRFLYLWHNFPSSSDLGGGQVNVGAMQVRVALTDRLAFIAPKDGWAEIKTGATGSESGWLDYTLGLKYAFIVDEAREFILTGGIRWELHSGTTSALQGGGTSQYELSPFVSVAKGWDRWNFIGNLTWRAPVDRNDGNHIISWDLHFDTEIAPETLPGFFPLVELHALHYITNGNAIELSSGGLDYSNIGASDVAGTSVFWGDLGFRWKLTPNLSWGVAYGFPISNPSNDAFNQRVSMDLVIRF